MRSLTRDIAVTPLLVTLLVFASCVQSSNLEPRSSSGGPGFHNESKSASARVDIMSVCTSSAENLVCCNDMGWYAFYVSRLANEVTTQVVIVNLGNMTVVNSTVGEIISMITADGAGGNVLELASVTISYGNDIIIEVNGAQLLGLLDNSVTVEDILSQLQWAGTISGPEVLNITFSVNIAGVPVGAIAVGDLVGEGDPTAVLGFIQNILDNGPIINFGELTVNNYTLAEIAEIFGLTGQVGPITIDPSAILDLSFDFPNFTLTTPPGWMIQMLDSSAIKSVPSGVARLNTLNVGNFRQCLNTKADETQSMTVPIAGTELPLTATYFEGQYCWVYLDGWTPSQKGLPIPPGLIANRAGMCFPDSCSEETLLLLLTAVLTDPALNEVLQQLGFPIQYIENCSNNKVPALSTVEVITVVILVLFSIALVVGTIADYLQIRKRKADEKATAEVSNPAMKYVLAFSIIRNAKTIMDTSKGKGADVIDCLFGIRFISMTWVLLGHTYSSASNTAFETDPLGYFEIFQKWTYMPLMNAFPAVDTFFFMGGLLVTYVMLKNLDRHGLSWAFIPKLYVHRYLRLTPLYGLVMLISYAFMMRVGSGPFWQLAYAPYFQGCEDKWWHNLLYISTILSPIQECVGHGWYLTNDMLYFLATPFLVIPMYLAGGWGTVFTFFALGASIGITASVHLAYDAPGAMPWSIIIAPEKQQQLMQHVYFKPHTRFGVYTVGILAGFLLYRTRRQKVKLPGGVVILGWASAIATGLAVIYGLFERENEAIDEDTLLAYGILHRQAWGFALAWVVFACVNGYAGFINTFLSWSFFRPLGRLAYASFLVHIYVVMWSVYAAKTQRRLDAGMQIYNFIANLILTHAVAFCAAVAIEFPLGTISNMLLDAVSKKLSPKAERSKDYYGWKHDGRVPSNVTSSKSD